MRHILSSAFLDFPRMEKIEFKEEETKNHYGQSKRAFPPLPVWIFSPRSFRDLCAGIVLDGDVSTSHCSRCCFSSNLSPGALKQSDNRGSQSRFCPTADMKQRRPLQVTGQGHGGDVAAANNHLLPHDIMISSFRPNLHGAADTLHL